MPRKFEIEFANFVCRFGSHDMSRFLAGIVLPALLEHDRMRARGKNFHVFDAQVVRTTLEGKPAHLVAMRIARDGVLKRDAVLDEGEIVASPAQMPMAGHGVVALILETHRLVYLPETSHAPWLGTIRGGVLRNLRRARQVHIDTLVTRATVKLLNPSRSELSQIRSEIEEGIPMPTLDIVPLAGTEAVTQALGRFTSLTRINIRLAPKNAELDNDALFRHIQATHDALGAKTTAVTHSNPKGMNTQAARDELHNAMGQGTVQVTMEGEDAGGSLKIRNDEITFRQPVSIDTGDVAEAAKEMAQEYVQQLKAKKLGVPNIDEHYAYEIGEQLRAYNAERTPRS